MPLVVDAKPQPFDKHLYRLVQWIRGGNVDGRLCLMYDAVFGALCTNNRYVHKFPPLRFFIVRANIFFDSNSTL